jgi:hypothetical protein
MQTTHTPGPWRVAPSCRNGNGTAWRDILSDGAEFAPSYVGEALDVDAALIAAAPDLLAALQHALERFEAIPAHRDEMGIYRQSAAIARAAIARATGI